MCLRANGLSREEVPRGSAGCKPGRPLSRQVGLLAEQGVHLDPVGLVDQADASVEEKAQGHVAFGAVFVAQVSYDMGRFCKKPADLALCEFISR